MKNHQRNVEIDWIFTPNDGKHSRKKHLKQAERIFFCIYAISNWKWMLLNTANMRIMTRKIPRFHVKTLFIWFSRNSVAEAQQSKQWRKQKTHKKSRRCMNDSQPALSKEKGDIEKKRTAHNVRQDWFFSFFFHRCLVCEVRSRDLYFQFVHKYRSAYT